MLTGEKTVLRPMEQEDMQLYSELFNSEEISKMVVGWGMPVSLSEQMNWFDKAKSDGRNRRFTVLDRHSGEKLGMASLSAIDWQCRKATLGIKLSDNCPKRQGYASDVLLTLIRFAFYEMNLNRLEASWITYNSASKGLYTKCGFTPEGIRRKAVYRSGEYHDLEVSGLLREDFDRMEKGGRA